MTVDLISNDPEVQAHYERMIEEGSSPRFAEMCALQVAPGCRTDSTVFRGAWHTDQFDLDHHTRQYGEVARKVALANGVNPKGKKYMHTLAEKPFDPKAWVDSTHDAQKLVEERGWTASGAINVKRLYQDAAPREKYDVNPKVVDRELRKQVAENPAIAPTPKDRKKLREQIRTKMLPGYAT